MALQKGWGTELLSEHLGESILQSVEGILRLDEEFPLMPPIFFQEFLTDFLSFCVDRNSKKLSLQNTLQQLQGYPPTSKNSCWNMSSRYYVNSDIKEY